MNMDFLDPRRRRAHRRRLTIGYGLMSVLVALATLIVFYLAYGYDIDRKTGNLIQNGIVFVDSKPQGARVYLDNKLHSDTTDTRLALPAGVYTIRVEMDGFRNWERTFTLEGGELERLVYPKLIPNNFATTDIRQYEILPSIATQSPDRRWVLVQRPGQTYQFDVFDLNDIEKAPKTIIVPPQILTDQGDDASLEFVEWSTDNRHLVFKRIFDNSKKNEYLVFDRENPSESLNINKTLGVSPTFVSLKNKRPDQIYYIEGKSSVLRWGNTKNKTISAPLGQNVMDYRTYGDDLVLMVTHPASLANNKARFVIASDGTSYTLKEVERSADYVLDVSRYDNKYYFVAGSSVENLAFVYENPLDALRSNGDRHLSVMIMRLNDPRFTSFSANTQFIVLQSGHRFLALDLEDGEQYRVELDQDIRLDNELVWMDGHRLQYAVDDQSYMVDFDGSNVETLVTSRLLPGPFWDRDYDNIYTFEESKVDGAKKAFTKTVIDEN